LDPEKIDVAQFPGATHLPPAVEAEIGPGDAMYIPKVHNYVCHGCTRDDCVLRPRGSILVAVNVLVAVNA
jgi:hypothetical protein